MASSICADDVLIPAYDTPGAVISTVGLLGVVYGLTRAQANGWGSPLTLSCVLVGAALLAIFVLVELRAANPPAALRVVLDLAKRNVRSV